MTTERQHRPLKVLVFGTADTGKPRVRLLLEALELAGHEVLLCTSSIWRGTEDKSGIKNPFLIAWLALKWLGTIIALSVRYLVAPKHDLMLVCYPGQMDLWPARLLTWLRRKPLVWDAFLSAYDTVVLDRAMAGPKSPLGRLAFFADWAACRLADRLFLDTPAHARFFEDTFRLDQQSVGSVPVGAEQPFHGVGRHAPADGPLKVLFYGQLIPLHGLETILDAAARLSDEDVTFTIAGRGQLGWMLQAWLAGHRGGNVTYRDWVPYGDLPDLIAAHHVGLGIFSAGGKAGRVVPNKIYQMLAVGLPVITRRSEAIAEFLGSASDGVTLIEPADGQALALAILQALRDHQNGSLQPPTTTLAVGPAEIAAALGDFLAGHNK